MAGAEPELLRLFDLEERKEETINGLFLHLRLRDYANKIRRRLLTSHRGEWDLAADWTPVWIGFGPRWRIGDEPLPWAAHSALWATLDAYPDHVRFQRRLGGIPRMPRPRELQP